jgi:hypothetical protein
LQAQLLGAASVLGGLRAGLGVSAGASGLEHLLLVAALGFFFLFANASGFGASADLL